MIDLGRLQQALRKLTSGQGRVARRNRRSEVFAAIREVRRKVNRDFPAIPSPSAGVLDRAKQDRISKRRRLRLRGWVQLNLADLPGQRLKDLAVAGIRVIEIRPTSRHDQTELWCPAWTLSVNVGDVAALRRGKRSLRERKALEVQRLLLKACKSS